MRMQQRGSVIIVTLWTITVMTILVAVIASQNRLSAQAAYFHQQDIATWAKIMSAMNQAEMDIMLEQMAPPVGDVEISGNDSLADTLNAAMALNPQYRLYRGDELQLNYPQADDIGVRIYNHAGKINLRQLQNAKLRAMIEHKLGGPVEADQQQVDQLMEAWNDWKDLNQGASVAGAEDDYYQSLDTPYLPRNGSLETVEELLLIRGFAEVFGDVDLDAAFTLYGEEDFVDPNLATVAAMRLLPGLDDELIEKIVAFREEKQFQGNGDVAQLVPAEKMAELRGWLRSSAGRNNSNNSYYTILVYQKNADENAADETEEESADDAVDSNNDNFQTAYSETVFVPTQSNRPLILKVNPYQRLPEHIHIESEDDTDRGTNEGDGE